jgi:hypothetical protein
MHERTDSLSPYFPFEVTAAVTASPLGNNVATTAPTTIVAGSDVVVTPVSMRNILAGMRLNLSAGTGTAEDVVVKKINVVGGTFTADFVNGHSGAYNIISFRAQYLGALIFNTTGFSNVIIYNGSPLLYNGGTGKGVQIASIATPSLTFPYMYNCYCSRGVFYTVTGTGSMTFMVTDDNV